MGMFLWDTLKFCTGKCHFLLIQGQLNNHSEYFELILILYWKEELPLEEDVDCQVEIKVTQKLEPGIVCQLHCFTFFKKKKKKINANVLFFFRSLTNGDIIHNLSYRYFRKIGQFHELPELTQFRLRSAVKVSLLFPVLQEKYKPLRIFHPFKWWNPFNFFVISRSHSKIIFRDKNQLKSLDFLF